MEIAALQVCVAAESDVIMGGDRTDKILAIAREYFEPEAEDSAY